MQLVRLGQLFKITSGGTPSKKNLEFYENGNIPWIKTGDLKAKELYNASEYITELGVEKSSAKLFPKNTVLIAMYGATIGATSILKIEATTNQACCAFLPCSKVLPEYLYYFFKVNKENIIAMGVGGAQPNISATILKEIKIPMIDLEKQEKIVTILDKAQELIDKRKTQIDALNELVKSKFIEMFGELKTNPNNFDIVDLETLTTKITDGVHSKPDYTSEGIPFISVKDINRGKLNFSDCKFISKEAHESYIKRCKPEIGDILYTKVGATYGIPAIVDSEEEFSLYVSVALLKLKKGIINPIYIKEALRSIDVKRQADRQVKGIGVPDLHLIEIKRFNVFNPPIELQNQFANFVNQIDKLKFEMQKSLEEMENNFKSLMQRAFK